jgi:hypothetical protein
MPRLRCRRRCRRMITPARFTAAPRGGGGGLIASG